MIALRRVDAVERIQELSRGGIQYSQDLDLHGCIANWVFLGGLAAEGLMRVKSRKNKLLDVC